MIDDYSEAPFKLLHPRENTMQATPLSLALTLAEPPLLSVEVMPVPQPETYALIRAGLGLLGFMVRRRLAV